MTRRSVAWVKDDPFGVEFAEVTLSGDSLSAVGVSVGTEPAVYRLDYTLQTGPRWVTTRLALTARGEGWERTLDLRRSDAGVWLAVAESTGDAPLPPPGGDVAQLTGAPDCDLGLSPLTNTMPVLREELLEGDRSVEFLMAWVSVPDLGVHASPQRYTSLERRLVRYESLDSDFTADITFDSDGLVVDYPGIGRRIEPIRA